MGAYHVTNAAEGGSSYNCSNGEYGARCESAIASILDSPELLDMAQPRGDILECLPEELKKEPRISVKDNEEAKALLVQILKKKCPSGDMQKLFKLTQMVYTSNSNQKGRGIAWVCDKHRDRGEQDGSLRRR